jgi:hypothetical protein
MSHYEPGDYSATVTRQGFAESKEKGTPYFFLDFEPVEALGANRLPEQIYPRTLKLWLTEAAAPYAFEKLKYLGWDGKRLGDLDPDEPNHHSFVNALITVRNTPEGEYDNFDLVRDGTGQVEHKTGLAAKLDKVYGKTLAAHAAGNGSKPAAKQPPKPKAEPQPEVVGVPDDEIPF